MLSATQAEGRTVVLPLLHGPLGEDGTVQGLLELADVPYVGSGVLGSALAMDKAMAKQVLAHHGIEQARWLGAGRARDRAAHGGDRGGDRLGLPLFVKPCNMGSSVGVTKARTVDEVADGHPRRAGLRRVGCWSRRRWPAGRSRWPCSATRCRGRRCRARSSPATSSTTTRTSTSTTAPACWSPPRSATHERTEVRRLAVQVFSALRCEGMARIDFFYEEGGRGFLCNEANTIPGFTPISMYPKLWQASGLSYPELIDELVRLALERHARRRRNTKR